MSLNIGIISSSYKAAAPSGNLLLDDYPNAAAAYSFRKLRAGYTGNCIRVQSSGTGTPSLDIGFVNNVLDTVTLLTFIGSNTGYITTWYDQSGNANNITKALGSIIVLSGVLITDNGKPAATNLEIYNLTNPVTPNNSYASYSVMSRTTSIGVMCAWANNTLPVISLVYNNGFVYNNNNVNTVFYNFTSIGRFLFSTINVANSQTVYVNNNLQTVTTITETGTGTFNRIFGRTATEGFQPTGKTQEQIFYNSNQAANNTGINANINAFYTIF